MELPEKNGDEKLAMISRVNKKKTELEEKAKALAGQTDKVILNAVAIAGTLALTFFIVRSIAGRSSKKSKGEKAGEIIESKDSEGNDQSLLSVIGSRIAEGATIFLLGLAKEQLAGYLKSRQRENENPQ
ncbi:MAG: hypothetical protein ACO3FI_01240 [Cyclobacteriaceae bacterium]